MKSIFSPVFILECLLKITSGEEDKGVFHGALNGNEEKFCDAPKTIRLPATLLVKKTWKPDLSDAKETELDQTRLEKDRRISCDILKLGTSVAV